MKRVNIIGCTMMVAFLVSAGAAWATPSTTYWTPATSDIQPFGVWHFGVDNYFRLAQSEEQRLNAQTQFDSFSTDVGVTVGVLPFEKLQMEIGIDGMFPGTRLNPALRSGGHALLFNAKLGVPEGALASWSPAFNVGIFNVGTQAQVTDMHIVDALIGKTLGSFGRIHGGGYYGNPNSVLMREGGCKPSPANPALACVTDRANRGGNNGKLDNVGGMVGYDFGFWKVKDKEGNEYNKWILAADYASGKNAIGGGGFGIYHFFTKDISLLTGPVWFNDHAINGQSKWTVQLDINY